MAERNDSVPEENRIEFRIGIHQVDIVVDDGDIFGDGINVAARLQGLTEPGGICVSARVQEDAAGKLDLDFEDLGKTELKNIRSACPSLSRPLGRLPSQPSPASGGGKGGGGRRANAGVSGQAVDRGIAIHQYERGPDQEFLADGNAEEIITALSGYPSLFVIASTAQLVESETGKHVWAERYDRNLADIFSVQDEIAEAVTIAITPAIAKSRSN
jgi:adenylate cyclase